MPINEIRTAAYSDFVVDPLGVYRTPQFPCRRISPYHTDSAGKVGTGKLDPNSRNWTLFAQPPFFSSVPLIIIEKLTSQVEEKIWKTGIYKH